jgi:hypothetical protein
MYLSAFFVSAGVPNGEFPEILIAKTGGTEGTLKIGRTIFCWGEINISCAGDPVHAGDKALTWETPAQRGRVNRYGYNMSGFLRFPPPIKLTTEILLKVVLNNMLYMGLLMT